jgi:predicted site-specific integrase-resolvase
MNGRRRYNLACLHPGPLHAPESERRATAYACVASDDHKESLERQKQVLELYCARQGWTFEVSANLGSGMTDYK